MKIFKINSKILNKYYLLIIEIFHLKVQTMYNYLQFFFFSSAVMCNRVRVSFQLFLPILLA